MIHVITKYQASNDREQDAAAAPMRADAWTPGTPVALSGLGQLRLIEALFSAVSRLLVAVDSACTQLGIRSRRKRMLGRAIEIRTTGSSALIAPSRAQ